MTPSEYPRTQTTFDHWAELIRLADGLDILANVARHHSDAVRAAAAWVDRGGEPATDTTLDRVRDELGEAHQAYIASHLKEARATARTLRVEQVASKERGAAA